MADLAPTSPCINVCVLDADGFCAGCYRTIGEIAGWRSLSAAEQWAVLRQLPKRVVARAPGPE
ncbi:MAG: DUF1289 domain-containing protein [Steroidobacteraceae bacterium]